MNTVENFAGWRGRSHLQLNIGKTKELLVDLWHSESPPTPVSINREGVEMVDTYRFVGVYMNNKLLVRQH